MTKVITIQPGQPGRGMEYDPMESLPYPFHLDEEGNVLRQDFWRGDPARVIGFAADCERWSMVDSVLTIEEFVEDPQRAVGLYPMFESGRKTQFRDHKPLSVGLEGIQHATSTVPITSVYVNAPRVVEGTAAERKEMADG